MWTVRKNGCITPLRRPGANESIGAHPLLPAADLSIIRSWVDFCVHHHTETCVSPVTRDMLPFKIIDCNTREILIAPSDTTTYLALSYVWGAPSPGDHQSQDSQLPATLPKVVEDAIIATNRMGLQYLWIDRYCIDQYDIEQRIAQINQMDLIYGNALAVLVAASSADSEFGLPGVESRKPSATVDLGHATLCLIPADHHNSITKSKWNTRGWTYQEIILAQRRIVFTRNQIYFECRGMQLIESLDMELELATNMSRELQESDELKMARLFNFLTKQDDPFEHIYEHIITYSQRQLTNSDDILNGLMGIFNVFKTIYPEFHHHFGIPIVPDTTLESVPESSQLARVRVSSRTEQFITGICWRHEELSPKRRDGEFPTWSWAGWEGHLGKIEKIYDYKYVKNTFGVKIHLLPVETSVASVCLDSDSYLSDTLARREWAPRILLETLTIPFRFVNFIRCWGKPGWIASITIDDQITYHGRLALEHPKGSTEIMDLCDTDFVGLLLGERLGISWFDGFRFVSSTAHRTVLILLVVKIADDVWERIGLLEIGDADYVEMDENEDVGMLKQMCLERRTTLLR
jgi:hypothetical protein